MNLHVNQTWLTKLGVHVHIFAVNAGRFMVSPNEKDPTSFAYAVGANGRTIFNDPNGDLVSRVQRIYVAGPMTGIPELNFPLFNRVSADLRQRGAHVENPAEINPDPNADWYDAMRRDIPRLLTCDTIALLPGWEKSRGASLEYHIAQSLGMSIVYLEV